MYGRLCLPTYALRRVYFASKIRRANSAEGGVSPLKKEKNKKIELK
jgi:hypothetical protein